jgi:hypothetical protein
MKDVLDQLLHMLWGFGLIAVPWLAMGLPGAPWWAVITGGGAAVIAIAPRELVDQKPDNLDTLWDFLGFGVGGVLGGLLPWLVGR